MNKKIVEQMLMDIDEKYLTEIIQSQKAMRPNTIGTAWKKIATAAAIIIIVLGTGISVVATASDTIQNWLAKNFLGHEVNKVEIGLKNEEKGTKGNIEEEPVDIPIDQNAHLSLAEDMLIVGEKESFVYQFHYEGDDEIVDQVYSIQGKGLKKLQPKTFRGNYDGEEFSFEYVTIHEEIFGFNSQGVGVTEVFHYIDGDKVYADLNKIEGDTYVKGCIAECNLKTGKVRKLTNDQTIGNMIMSPNGKIILINYRSKGYWTAFDLDSQTEKRIDGIDGYAHTKEVIFQDDYHVLTYGDTYMDEDTEMAGTQILDLRTGERTASYRQCGDYSLEWVYSQEDGQLTITHVDGTKAIQIDQVEGTPHPIASQGEYILLGDLEEEKNPYYLCNLKEKSYMKMDALIGMGDEISINLAAKEKLLLISNGQDAYLVDISKIN